jgi:hypothetical protein
MTAMQKDKTVCRIAKKILRYSGVLPTNKKKKKMHTKPSILKAYQSFE